MQNNDVSREILKLKKINSKNNIVIIVLSVVLFLVSALAIYIRFFA